MDFNGKVIQLLD